MAVHKQTDSYKQRISIKSHQFLMISGLQWKGTGALQELVTILVFKNLPWPWWVGKPHTGAVVASKQSIRYITALLRRFHYLHTAASLLLRECACGVGGSQNIQQYWGSAVMVCNRVPSPHWVHNWCPQVVYKIPCLLKNFTGAGICSMNTVPDFEI